MSPQPDYLRGLEQGQDKHPTFCRER